MTTFPMNTMLRGTKAAFLAFALTITAFGAGCAVEGAEGNEEGTDGIGENQQALTGKIGLDPTLMKEKCEGAGHVYDPSQNGCSATCAPGLVPADAKGFKCISPYAKCRQSAGDSFTKLGACLACSPEYAGPEKCPVSVSDSQCEAAGNYWAQEGKTCHTKGSIGHYDALCKHNGMEYDSSKTGNFPCKPRPTGPGWPTGPANTNCLSDPDCMVVLCNFPGNGSLSACNGG